MNTSWIMSLNRTTDARVKFGQLPKWARQYMLDLRRHHNVQLEVFGEVTRKWQLYSMTGVIEAKKSYRLAGAAHCAAIRVGYDSAKKEPKYNYVFATDPQPLDAGIVVSQLTEGAIVGYLKPL